MLTPYLICFPLSLVAANPILQRIPIQIPAQAWPTQPQTCSTQPQTCPTQTCPNVSKPAACQTCQNPYRNLFNSHQIVVQQPSSCPCSKPAVGNQPVSPDVLRQLILRGLLSPQPQPQTVLPAQNPGPVTCNPTLNPAPIPKVCNQCETHNPAPNIINNYIILPPEYFKANETKVSNDTANKKRKGKRRQQNRQRKPKDPECPCDDDLNHHDQFISELQVTTCPCDIEDTIEFDDPAKVHNSELKCVSKPKLETINDKIVPESVATTAEKVENSQNLQAVPRTVAYTEDHPEDIQNPKRRNRERTKSIEEAIIKDFCKKHPTIPEEIARSLLKKLKHQIESRDRPRYATYPYSPYSYGEYSPYSYGEYSPYTYPSMFYPQNKGRQSVQNDRLHSDRGSRRRRPKRPERRNKKQKEKTLGNTDNCDSKCEKLVERNPTVINIETETITTEKITATTENKHKDNVPVKESETQVETPDDLITQLEQMKQKFAMLNEIESTTVSHNKRIEYPELGKEDKVPTVYNNGVDDYDYYPDFRCDNIAFYGSNEERDKKPDRYRYTADKSGGLNCKNGKKRSNISNFNNDDNSCEYTFPISTESYDSYEESIKESEEISFKTPPPLELPDFETKHINRFPEINDEFVADEFYKATSYSDAKADLRMPEVEMKPAKVFTKDKTGRTNIETVFGHSRVVKYGQDSEGAGSDPVITYYLPEEAMTEDRIQLPDGEKAVVVAKSISDLVNRWE